MIGYLVGKPKIYGAQLLVLVQGVGYQVAVGQKILVAAQLTDQIELFIHTHVKEEALELFGFANAADKHLFLLLLNVSGVGPKTALVISEMGSTALHTAVQEADVTAFTKAPRVGKKLAQKIIIELKTKLGSIKELNLAEPSPHEQELLLALTSLGFAEDHIREAIKMAHVDGMMVEQALPKVLKVLQK